MTAYRLTQNAQSDLIEIRRTTLRQWGVAQSQKYLSQLRQTIRAETTKIESFHSFLDWIAFGGTVIKSGDPIEQAKRIKYMDVVANAIMLHNVVDLTTVLNEMSEEGLAVTPELIRCLSPYMCEHILRFGKLMVKPKSQRC